jgi:RimJ/RimL family protein N-acetyltransferase
VRLRSRPRIALPRESLRDGPTSLRPWCEDDIPALVTLCRDPEIVRWIGLSPTYGPDDARGYVQGVERSARAGLAVAFAIVDPVSDVVRGSISLMSIAWPDRRAEVGYWLGAEARGHGHVTRAVRLICGWGFQELGLERIALIAAVTNPASQTVADRAGFTREAILRSYLQTEAGRLDAVCFGRLATDPAARPDV